MKGRYGWPRLLSRELAADYCGVSVNHFIAHVSVAPRRLGARVLWDRHDIDKWIDRNAEAADDWETALERI